MSIVGTALGLASGIISRIIRVGEKDREVGEIEHLSKDEILAEMQNALDLSHRISDERLGVVYQLAKERDEWHDMWDQEFRGHQTAQAILEKGTMRMKATSSALFREVNILRQEAGKAPYKAMKDIEVSEHDKSKVKDYIERQIQLYELTQRTVNPEDLLSDEAKP